MRDSPARIRLWVAVPLALVNPVVACLYCGRARLAAWVLAAVMASTAVLWLGPLAPPGLHATLAAGLLLGILPSLGLVVWILWRVRRHPVALRWRWPALLAAFLATTLANPALWLDSPVGHFTIPSASMVPGLAVGDRAVSESPLRPTARPVEPGDVVFFTLPRDPDQQWVKRLVATGGDRVQMRGGVLHLNGVAVARRALPGLPATVALSGPAPAGATAWEETLPNGRSHVVLEPGGSYPLADTPEVLVPAGHGFVLGDNRANSTDSRVPQAIGFVPLDHVIGRGVLRYRLGDGWAAEPIR